MSEGEERIDAVGARKTREPGRKIDDAERGAARGRGTLPCEQHGERGGIELRERRAIDFGRACRDARQTRVEPGLRALVGQGCGRLETAARGLIAHDALPLASC